MDHVEQRNRKDYSGLIRIGGLAIIVGLGIHIIVNMVLKQFPPDDPTLDELKAYFAKEASTWEIVHGARYLAFLCIAIFAAGLFARTTYASAKSSGGWGIVGLLGAAMLLINAMITNGIEMFAFLDFELLSEQSALFWMLFYLTRVLWTAEMIAWAVLILGFSIAGWSGRALPKWLAGFGLLSATAGTLSAVFVVSILNDGWASIIIEIASMTGLAWFSCVGAYLLWKGAS